MNDSRIMNAFLSKLYQTITCPDDVTNTNSLDQNAFISFCVPGIPVSESSVDFLNFKTKHDFDSAAAFSRFVNSIPRPTGFWSTSASEIWDVYSDAINNAIVETKQLTAAQVQQLKDAHEKLYSQISTIDQNTGTITYIDVPSQLMKDYSAYETAYNTALRNLNTAVITANNDPNNNAAAQDLALNGPIYRQAVTDSYEQWMTVKNTVEVAQETIAELTSDGPALFFQKLRNDLAIMKMTDGLRSNFYPTTYYPESFWTTNGWTKLTFGQEEEHSYWNQSSTSWGGGTSGGWGLWSWGVGVSHSDGKTYDSCNTSNYSLSVEITQVPLSRPWFDSLIFMNRAWRLQPGAPVLSDGNLPPATQGSLPLIPTSLLLARNLSVSLNMTDTVNSTYRSETKTSGSVGWGPFSLRGNYDSVSSGGSHDYTSTDSGISCAGMQVIGFVCAISPKSPNPDTSLMSEAVKKFGELSESPLERFQRAIF